MFASNKSRKFEDESSGNAAYDQVVLGTGFAFVADPKELLLGHLGTKHGYFQARFPSAKAWSPQGSFRIQDLSGRVSDPVPLKGRQPFSITLTDLEMDHANLQSFCLSDLETGDLNVVSLMDDPDQQTSGIGGAAAFQLPPHREEASPELAQLQARIGFLEEQLRSRLPYLQMYRFGAGSLLVAVVSLLVWVVTGAGAPFHPVFAVMVIPAAIGLMVMAFLVRRDIPNPQSKQK
jgi:hypothetical protein